MGSITRQNEICPPRMCQSVNVAYFLGRRAGNEIEIGIDLGDLILTLSDE